MPEANPAPNWFSIGDPNGIFSNFNEIIKLQSSNKVYVVLFIPSLAFSLLVISVALFYPPRDVLSFFRCIRLNFSFVLIPHAPLPNRDLMPFRARSYNAPI